VALNTADLGSDDEARAAIEATETETGLVADDVVRFGPERVLDAVVAALP
jgi:D-glutamate N-acetyltransferase